MRFVHDVLTSSVVQELLPLQATHVLCTSNATYGIHGRSLPELPTGYYCPLTSHSCTLAFSLIIENLRVRLNETQPENAVTRPDYQ